MSPISRRDLVASAAGLTLVPRFGSPGPVPSAPSPDQLAAETPYWLAASGTPGLTVALLDKGRTRSVHCFGTVDGGTTPVTEQTMFQAASLSKQALLYAALKTIEAGKLDLDRPLVQYRRKPLDEPEAQAERVTARMVLTHTTGWPNWPPENGRLKVVNPPGQWGYSGAGFVYLMETLESIWDQTAAEYSRKLVLDPLGMEASSFVWRPEYETTATVGFDSDGAALKQRKPEKANGASSLVTTAREYARLLEAFLAPELRRRHPDVFTPQVAIDPRLGWSLGWGTGGGVLWQWGHNPGFKAFAAIAPDRGRGIVCLSNGAGGQRVNRQWVDGWMGAELPAFFFRMVDL